MSIDHITIPKITNCVRLQTYKRNESREQSNTKKNRDSAQKWLDNQGIPKFVNETNSKKVPTEELFVEENIGEYFIDQQTGEFFLITILENGEIGKVRKG